MYLVGKKETHVKMVPPLMSYQEAGDGEGTAGNTRMRKYLFHTPISWGQCLLCKTRVFSFSLMSLENCF